VAGRCRSALTLPPLIVIWSTTRFGRWNYRQVSEAVLILAVVLAISVIGFGRAVDRILEPISTVSVVPAVLWAAYCFRQRGAITAAIVASSVAIWGTLHVWSLLPLTSTSRW